MGFAAVASIAMVLAYVPLLAAEMIPVSRGFDAWSAPPIIGLIVPPFALDLMGVLSTDASRRAHTT